MSEETRRNDSGPEAESHDALEQLAALADGSVTAAELSDDTLGRVLDDGGVDVLAASLAARAAPAADQSRSGRGEDPPSIETAPAPLARIGPATFRRSAAAAAVLLVAGISIVVLRPAAPGPDPFTGPSPLDWSTPLAGRSGLLDGGGFKSADALLRDLLLPRDAEVDAIAPARLDVDADGVTDAVSLGLLARAPGGADEPWAILTFVRGPEPTPDAGVDADPPTDDAIRRWGLPELARAGFRTGLLSRSDGVHALLRLDATGTPENLAVDLDGDGLADRRIGPDGRLVPVFDIFLLDAGELTAARRSLLVGSHRIATSDGATVPRLPLPTR